MRSQRHPRARCGRGANRRPTKVRVRRDSVVYAPRFVLWAVVPLATALCGCSESPEPSPPAPEPIAAPAEPATGEALIPVLAEAIPEDWTRPGDVEHYTAAPLHEKLGEGAAVFRDYGVASLTYQTLMYERDMNQFIDVYLYDMSGASGSFGVFSVERDRRHAAFDAGREGYIDGSGVYFWKGRYYVSIIPTDDTPEALEAAEAIAARIDHALVDSGGTVPGLDALPRTNLDTGSVRYFMKDAMGQPFMTNTLSARYTFDGVEVRGFLTERESSADATEVAGQYVAYMERYADDIQRETVEGVEIILAEMGGVYDAVFAKNEIVAGVASVPDRGAAESAAKQFAAALP